jgi:hypothetical protein
VPVEVLREAVRQRVLDASLRVVAAEISVSHRGLEGFIKGARPHPQTVRKLTEWHLKRAAAGETTVTPELAQAAVGVLLQHLPPGRREQAAGRLLTVLRGETQAASSPFPLWLAPPADPA